MSRLAVADDIVDIPRALLLGDYVRHYASETPEAEATEGGGFSFTYRQLAEAIAEQAAALRAAGVLPGDRIAVLSTPHPLFWTTFLAAADIGAIWVGLNPKYRVDELAYVVRDCAPRLIIARTRIERRDYAADLNAIRRAADPSGVPVVALPGDPAIDGSISWTDFIEFGQGHDRSPLQPKPGERRPCLLVYTSGTTGRPKGAVLHHHGLIEMAVARLSAARARPWRIVNYLPVNHVGCVGDVGCASLVAGGSIVFLEQFDPIGALALMAERKATVWGTVPTAFQMSVANPDFDAVDLSSLQLISWGGARMPAELIPILRGRCAALSTDYGMTETIGSVTYTALTDSDEVLARTVGRPVAGFDVRLVDITGMEVATGIEGEVQVRGGFVMLGYWNRPEATDAAFTSDGWFRTGDLGVMGIDGSLVLVGRLSEMFKSGGYNVYPKEIENAIETFPGIAAVSVVGMSDQLYGEVGYGFIVGAAEEKIDLAALVAHLRGILAPYKIPKHFMQLAALPLLPLGKVDRVALRHMAEARQETL